MIPKHDQTEDGIASLSLPPIAKFWANVENNDVTNNNASVFLAIVVYFCCHFFPFLYEGNSKC